MCLDKGASNGATDGAREIHAPPPTQISPDKPSEVVPESIMYLPEDILELPNLNIPETDDVLPMNINIWDYDYNSIYAPFSLAFPSSPPKMEINQPADVVVNNHNDKVVNDDNEVVITGNVAEPVNLNVVVSDLSNEDETVAPTANDKDDVEVIVKRKRGRPRKYPIKDSVVPPRRSARKRKAAATIVSDSEEEHLPSAPIPLSPDISGSAPGSGFVPHVITVRKEEDVLERLLSFARVAKQAVCVLSTNGTISDVTLKKFSGNVTYQGRFEILSLSGSFLPSELGGKRSTSGGLSVSLAGPNGCVVGGVVAGLLTAASDVQIIVGTFEAAGQESRT